MATPTILANPFHKQNHHDKCSPEPQLHFLERIATALERLAQSLDCVSRIAAKLDPPPADIIDSAGIAARLGCTTTWIAELARSGRIPATCIVPGSGNGKVWKFYRAKIDAWLASR